MKISTIITLALTACALLLTSACNTIEGMGTDVKRGGEKLEDSASGAKKKM